MLLASVGYKPIVCGVVVLLAVIAVIVLRVLKKKPGDCVFVAIVAAVCCGIVLLTSIQGREEYYTKQPQSGEVIGTVTLSVRCDTIAGRGENGYIPADGTIIDTERVELVSGDTAFTVLVKAAREHGISMESHGAIGENYELVYVNGINYIYELQFGELSGWVYHVNGAASDVGCGSYVLKDGDSVEWLYSCESGNDLG